MMPMIIVNSKNELLCPREEDTIPETACGIDTILCGKEIGVVGAVRPKK